MGRPPGGAVDNFGQYRILQLSDIHFGSRSHSYRDRNIANDAQHSCAARLAQEVTAVLKDKGMWLADRRYQFDSVVLSGDLTSFSEEYGFQASVRLADEVRHQNWGSIKDILVIPGNHDLIFGEPAAGKPGLTPEVIVPLEKSKREEMYCRYFPKLTATNFPPASGLSPNERCLTHVKVDEQRQIVLIGLDSCRLESWASPGLGFVGFDQVNAIMEELWSKYESQSAPWRRLAFVHHHIDDWMTRAPRKRPLRPGWQRNFSFTADAAQIRQAMDTFAIDLIAHGHYHVPDPRPKGNTDPAMPRIFSAGSAGVCSADCDGVLQFFVYEIYESLTPPKLVVYDFRTNLRDPAGQWILTSWPFTLPDRRAYRRTDRDLKERNAWSVEASAFASACETYPLAFACLKRLDPFSNQYAEFVLFERLTPLWDGRRQGYPEMPFLTNMWGDIASYMQRNAAGLLAGFEQRLDDAGEFLTFEHFLLEKMAEDGMI